MKKDIKQFWKHNIHPITGFNQPKQDVRMSIEGRRKHYHDYQFGIGINTTTKINNAVNYK